MCPHTQLPLPERAVAPVSPDGIPLFFPVWGPELSIWGCSKESEAPFSLCGQGLTGLDSDTDPGAPNLPYSQVGADATSHLLTLYSASIFLSLPKHINNISDIDPVSPLKPGQ